MSPINNTENNSNDDQLFTMEEINQTENDILRQDSLLSYSIDPEISQTTQNESTQIIPQNLDSLHFPILDDDNNSNNNISDLDNRTLGKGI
jgi:monomeric isocitrate dehydrogenase